MPPDLTIEPSQLNSQGPAVAGRLKRVLYVLDLNPVGKFPSLAEQALVLARAFRERGSLFLPVYLGPLDPGFVNRHTGEGVAIEGLDLGTFRWAGLRRLLQLVREHRIEVVHWNFYHPLVNGYLWALTVLAPAGRAFLYGSYFATGGRPGRGRGANLKWVLKWPLSLRYRKTLCISEYVKSELQQQHWLNLQVVYNFINTERFHPDPDQRREVRRSVGAGDEFVALTVAYLIKDKGIDVAVRAPGRAPRRCRALGRR